MIGKEILNYRITSLIGKGGMGSVYLAEHKLISKEKVAIKVINANMANDFTRKMLQDEAEHLAGLNHPNIVSFKNYHIDDKGNIYLIMEYADGKNLEQYINQITGLIVEDRICSLFEPILDAVGYAHKKHILHRDIKPANVVITTEGTPKILDFGIAKIISKQQEDEKDNVVMGTPSYMSPEQVKGEHLDERSDIYSLGVLLHQMLTGNAPYDTTTLTEQDINMKVVEEPLPRMRTFYKYVSEKVQKVVDKATAKDPKDRYQSCEDFKKDLHRAIYPWRPKTWLKCVTAAAAILIIGGGLYIWDYNRVKVAYFKDYVERWGIPEGVGKVSSDNHTHLSRCYKFVEQRRKLLSVSHVNSLDHLIDDGESERNDRPVYQEFTYTEKGKVSRVKVKDRGGKVLYVKSYNEKLNVMVLQYDDSHNTERTISNSTIGYGRLFEDNNSTNGRISRWWIEYDENGFTKSVRYHSLDNSAVGDENGIYGSDFVRDSKGRTIEVHYVGIDDEPQSTKWGLGIKKFEYDTDDNWVKATYLTIDGKTAFDDIDGTAIYSMEYDEYGNIINAYHLNADGKPMLPKKSYIAGVRHLYNDKGLEIKTTYLDVELKPMYVREQGIAIVKTEYDQNGYPVRRSFYDPQGNLVNSKQGNASFETINDDKGNALESWMKDDQGELCEIDYGIAGFKTQYDSIGNITQQVFYGSDKETTLGKDGSAGYINKYNNLNLISEVTYLGEDLTPAPTNDNVIMLKKNYDKRGNLVKCAFYEADGVKLRLNNEGVAGWTCIYDENGNELELSFFDEQERPTMSNAYHYAKRECTYDENSNLNSVRYLNVKGNLTVVNGSAGTDYINDKRGNTLESKPIGNDGNLAKGQLITRYKYDEFDNQTEMAMFDKKGPALDDFNVHKYVYIFNSRNQVIEKRYYGKDNKLTTHSYQNCAIEKFEYNDRGERASMSVHGADGKPSTNKEGWSSATYEYDDFGNVIKQCFFNTKGKPTDPKVMVPVGICKYDKWGNMIYLAALDGNNKFIINPNTGWSIMRAEYNISGKVLMQAYYSEQDKPMINKVLKYHKITYTYDKNGNQTSEAYWKNEKEPMSVNGIHKKIFEYDKFGNNTVITFWNTKNKPTTSSGYHKTVLKYNESGQLIESAYYGINGNRVVGEYGIHRIALTYAKDGVTALYTYFYDTNNKLMLSQKWNGSEWVVMENRMSTPAPATPSVNWKDSITEMQELLPLDLGKDANNLIMESVKLTGKNSYTFYFSMPYSKYEVSQEQFDTYILYIEIIVMEFSNQLEKELKSSSVPQGHYILLDSKGREVYKN